jgi:hypothetical protein
MDCSVKSCTGINVLVPGYDAFNRRLTTIALSFDEAQRVSLVGSGHPSRVAIERVRLSG